MSTCSICLMRLCVSLPYVNKKKKKKKSILGGGGLLVGMSVSLPSYIHTHIYTCINVKFFIFFLFLFMENPWHCHLSPFLLLLLPPISCPSSLLSFLHLPRHVNIQSATTRGSLLLIGFQNLEIDRLIAS